jgi:tRNA uridine 5-carboxymethylaminomethyl modification enzyme
MDDVLIPATLDYAQIQAMSYEAREKLNVARPVSLGQARRVPGVSPNDIQGLVGAILRERDRHVVSRETSG